MRAVRAPIKPKSSQNPPKSNPNSIKSSQNQSKSTQIKSSQNQIKSIKIQIQAKSNRNQSQIKAKASRNQAKSKHKPSRNQAKGEAEAEPSLEVSQLSAPGDGASLGTAPGWGPGAMGAMGPCQGPEGEEQNRLGVSRKFFRKRSRALGMPRCELTICIRMTVGRGKLRKS